MSLFDPYQSLQEKMRLQQEAERRRYEDMLKAYQQAYQGWIGQWGNNLLGGLGGLGQIQALNPAYTEPARPVKLDEEQVVAAVPAWRRWSVTMFGDVLMSNNGTVWTPYARMQAECKAGKACQGIACGCGIYAYKTREQAENGENAPTTVTHVWGEVWLWGRIIECSKGFRAQFAYPKTFVNTGGIAQQLAYAYGVKVIA